MTCHFTSLWSPAKSRTFLSAALCVAAVSTWANESSAQPAPAASAPTDATPAPTETNDKPAETPTSVAQPMPSTPTAGDQNAQWRAAYEQGKSALANGAFPPALKMLNDVAEKAPDPTLRSQAQELSHLASYWSRNGYRLVPPVQLTPPAVKLGVPLKDERTIDELAILYGNAVIWGTGFGFVVGIAADSSEAATYFMPAIGMAALGAGAVALMDVKFDSLGYGVPQSITSGMYMGLEAGIYMTGIMTAQDVIRDNEEKVYPGLVWGSATAGALLGGLVGATTPVTPGRASFTSTGALWGGLVSSLLTIGITNGKSETAPWVTGLIGATAGGITTGLLADYVSPSIARVRFIDLGAFAGGLVFGGLYASVADRMDGQAFAFLTSAGVMSGIALSSFLTKNMERDEPRRRYVRKSAELRLSPFMTPHQGGGTFGLAGSF